MFFWLLQLKSVVVYGYFWSEKDKVTKLQKTLKSFCQLNKVCLDIWNGNC